jgi:hypothetical protein
MAAQRPNLPIITVTANARVANQLALTYANSAFVRPYSEDFGYDLGVELKKTGYLQLKEGKKDLGDLPAASAMLLVGIGFIWVVLAIYTIYSKVKAKKQSS